MKPESKKTKRASEKPTVVSLFSGIGGLDFGFEAAGFSTRVTLELDSTACRTIRLNRDWNVIEAAIEDTSSKAIMSLADLRKKEPDVLIGGPPCQPFSKSGYWKSGDAKRLSDPRANTLTQYLRVLADLQPRVFLLENVPGLAFDEKSEGLTFLLKGIEEINKRSGTKYKPSWKVLNAAAFGVPQIRERLFLIGSRDGRQFRFPEPRFRPAEIEGSHLPPYRTAWDALGDLPSRKASPDLEVGGKWGKLLPSIPEGQNYLWHTARGGGQPMFGWRTRYWSFLLKLAKNKPSWTIQAQPGPAIGPFHWENRRLAANELCRLQTFPDGLKFDCGRSEVQRMIGNAVPSLLAEILAKEIRSQLLDGLKSLEDPSLLPPHRGVPPGRAKPAAVPPEYLSLVGDHAEHPGTGKGSGAKARNEAQSELFPKAAKSRAA